MSCIDKVKFLELPVFVDPRGSLTAGETGKAFPFEAKRYFLIFDVGENQVRGEHAHRECHQLLVCVNGHCSVGVDDGQQKQEYRLERPNQALYIPPMIWGSQFKHSPDAVLLVLASHPYENSDYIRDYGQFLKEARH